jgi:threonine/homoserine/homoserine lactone efflux protein
MDISFFIKGLVVGFLIAMPVGPVALVCIERSLNRGRLHGIISGLGAAMADALYGFVATFGLTFISSFLIKEQKWLDLIGGIFICFIGLKIFLSKYANRANVVHNANYVRDFLSVFLLTVANPLTFLALTAAFAGLGFVRVGSHYPTVILLVTGVFIGSGVWWLMLSSIISTFLRRIGYGKLVWLSRISGLAITVFGLFVLLDLL